MEQVTGVEGICCFAVMNMLHFQRKLSEMLRALGIQFHTVRTVTDVDISIFLCGMSAFVSSQLADLEALLPRKRYPRWHWR
jgi:hypothetical protein